MSDADRRPGLMIRLLGRPVLTAVMIAGTLGGAWLGHLLLAEAVSPLRAVLGGAVAGVGCGLLVTFTKLAG